MKTLTIRNIDDDLSNILKEKAKTGGTSLNACVINLLKQITGLSKQQFSKKYSDLDFLAGTWEEKDYNEFNNNVKSFNEIDKDIWK